VVEKLGAKMRRDDKQPGKPLHLGQPLLRDHDRGSWPRARRWASRSASSRSVFRPACLNVQASLALFAAVQGTPARRTGRTPGRRAYTPG
jgi:hypothetical protein